MNAPRLNAPRSLKHFWRHFLRHFLRWRFLHWRLLVRFALLAFLSALVFALGSCTDSAAYREYEVFNESAGRFGQNALLEENLLARLRVKKLLRDGITWTKPPAWKEGEAGDFRLAAFLTDDFLEITLVHFPDAAGGIRANINRWAGQVNLAFSPRKISDYINDLVLYKTSSDLPYILINVLDIDENISDENTENVLVAIFLFEDEILFIKMLGGDDQLKKQENDFLNFVASIALKK